MKYLTSKYKQLICVFGAFWIVPFILFCFSFPNINSNLETYNFTRNENIIFFGKIALNNLYVGFLIIISGFIFKYVPYFLYGYNSVMFSILLSISTIENGLKITLLKLLPHSFTEIIGLSVCVLIGRHIKKDFRKKDVHKCIFFAVFIIIIAAFIEAFISNNMEVVL